MKQQYSTMADNKNLTLLSDIVPSVISFMHIIQD